MIVSLAVKQNLVIQVKRTEVSGNSVAQLLMMGKDRYPMNFCHLRIIRSTGKECLAFVIKYSKDVLIKTHNKGGPSWVSSDVQ